MIDDGSRKRIVDLTDTAKIHIPVDMPCRARVVAEVTTMDGTLVAVAVVAAVATMDKTIAINLWITVTGVVGMEV